MKHIAFASIAVLFASACDAPSDQAAKPAGPPVVVSAADLSQAFQENEAKAKMTYDGKTLQVTGTVKDITLDLMDKPVIALRGKGEQYGSGISSDGKMTDVSVSGLPNEVAAEIKKGAEMTFICSTVGEVMGSAQVSDCTIAK